MSVYPFIAAEQVAAGHVSQACALVEVSRSACSVGQPHVPSARSLADERLGDAIVEIHRTSRRTYGAPTARTKALLRLLIGEIRVVSPTDIRPTYRVPADVRIPEGWWAILDSNQ